jgi:ubiquinone biosynthesis protein COQ9
MMSTLAIRATLRRFPSSVRCSAFSTSSFEGKTDYEIRQTILQTAMGNVPLLGWTDDALAKAMKDIGYDSLSHTMIASGPVDLVTHFMTTKREHVSEQLSKKYALVGLDDDGEQSNSNEVVRDAIEMHLDYIAPYLSSWPKALALLAEPSQIPNTVQMMVETSDDICHFAGLKSSRLDWYSDRGLVLTVFCSTELYMLTDYSENMQDTRYDIHDSLTLTFRARSFKGKSKMYIKKQNY